ncbi:MAG: glycine/sarcosine/betaine reductase selenoprotein B family protein [Pseudomonadota bacterium]
MDADAHPETFKAFKDSLSYGIRTDLNFKFLSHLSDAEAGRFFQELLRVVAGTVDEGDPARLTDLVLLWQAAGYREQKNFGYETGPFTPMTKPLSEIRLAVMASSGHFVAGDDPKPFGVEDMSQETAVQRVMEFVKAEPVLSAIPVDTPPAMLRLRHPGYDITGAAADPNVALPLERLRELAAAGLIGELSPVAYSFVGACSQKRLLKRSGPEWVARLVDQAVDAALLVPV